MQRAIARQAEAERERRAKIISADGEFQAAEKLAQAANIISANPATLQLRYLQTLLDIGVNQNSTIIFPLPLDMVKPFLGLEGADGQPGRGRQSPEAPSSPERSRSPHRPAHRAAGDPGPGAGPAARCVRPGPACHPRGRRRDLSLLRGPRGPHPAGGLGAPPGRRRARLAGLDGAGGAEPVPGARRHRGRRALGDGQRAASRGAGDRPGELDRPAAAPRPGRASRPCSRHSPPRAPMR